jgi:hypothetical protein
MGIFFRKVALSSGAPSRKLLPILELRPMQNLPASSWLVTLSLAWLMATAPSAMAELTHRYSFASDASDTVGGRHGTLHGNASVSLGAVDLDGTAGTYIELPGDLIEGYTRVTFESWAFFGDNAGWVRLFDVGDTNPSTSFGRNYIFLSPQSGAGDVRIVISDADPGFDHEELVARPGGLNNSYAHLAAVLDPERGWIALYIDGRLVSSNPNLSIPLSAVANNFFYLGRALYGADPYLSGYIEEFRIYNTALSSSQIAASHLAGADTPGLDPGSTVSLTISLPAQLLVEGETTPQLTGTFSNVGQIPLGVTDVALSSSSPSTVEVRPNGTLRARAPGSAIITAELDGITVTANLTVVSVPAEIRHRYSMNEPAGSSTVTDSVGGQHGTVHPAADGPGLVTFENGQAIFPGGASYVNGPYIDLPDYIISTKQNLSIETWATWNGPTGSLPWQRIFDFGSSTKGNSPHDPGAGTSSFWLSPRSGGNVIRFDAWNGTDIVQLTGTSFLPVGQESHIVCIYAPDSGVSQLWVNGVRIASGPTPFALSSMQDVNNWLGLAQWDDAPFNGAIREFRIYEGALTELDIALRRQSGPDALPAAPGLLQTLSLDAPALLAGNPMPSRATLLAHFENLQDVDVSGLSSAQFESSDSTVFTVTSGGNLLPVGLGSAELVASYGGLSVTAAVEVLEPVSLSLAVASPLHAGGPDSPATLTAAYPGDITAEVTQFPGVEFRSTAAATASVAANGNILPLRVGTTTVEASLAGLSASTTVQVVLPPNHRPATLIHRYRFDEPSGSTIVSDSVGTAHGELRNPTVGSDFTGTGRVRLAGGAWNAVPEPAYVNLPNGLVSGLESLTIEAWVNWAGPADSSWQRIFDFGRNAAVAEDTYGNPGLSYMFLSPRSGANTLRFAIREGEGPELPVLDAAPLPVNQDIHVAVVYDTAAGAARMYMNGQRVATGPITYPLSVVEDLNVYLGRAQWTDPKFAGEFLEFRIYEGTYLDDELAATFAAGPDQLPDLTPAPRLEWLITDGTLRLSWPAVATGYILESSARLGPTASWAGVPGTPTVEGDTMRFSVPLSSDAVYYRLRQ